MQREKRMNVNHFNTFPYGGAATAALRLHAEYLKLGHDSRFYFSQQDRQPDLSAPLTQIQWRAPDASFGGRFLKPFEKRRVRRIHRMYDKHLAQRDPNLELFSMAEQVERNRLNSHDFSSGIVHLHWIAFMSDFQTLFRSIPSHTPIVWTLHDMNPITGGCHYSGGCERFKSGCGSCPQLLQRDTKDLSSHSFGIKAGALRRKNITIASPSRWLLELAKASPLFPESTSFHHIRLGFDLKQLRPEVKVQARERLGIAPDVPLIGFGAEAVGNPRKGLDLLLPALAQLNGRHSLQAAVFGSGKIGGSGLNLPKIHSLGYVSQPEKMRDFYSACDVVVVPSREDNQPQVGLEAMACGTPVVAFDVGGVGEYVRPGVTGWLAQAECSQDLATQIEKLIVDHAGRQKMSEGARQLIAREFDIATQAKKYVELYRNLEAANQRQRSA